MHSNDKVHQAIDLIKHNHDNLYLVILHHGMGCLWHNKDYLIDAFVHQGYDVWTYDQRGVGKQHSQPHVINRVHDHIADLHQVISQSLLYPYTRRMLVGFSYGSAIALQCLKGCTHINGLCLINPYTSGKAFLKDSKQHVNPDMLNHLLARETQGLKAKTIRVFHQRLPALFHDDDAQTYFKNHNASITLGTLLDSWTLELSDIDISIPTSMATSTSDHINHPDQQNKFFKHIRCHQKKQLHLSGGHFSPLINPQHAFDIVKASHQIWSL